MNATGSPRLSSENCEVSLSSLPKVSRSPTHHDNEHTEESLNNPEKTGKLIESASASPNSRSGCAVEEDALHKRGENGVNGSSERTNGGGSSEEQIDEIIEENGSTPKQGRFNLRKRSNVFGSYEGYNDSDMSGQLNGKKVYNYDTNTLIAAAKKMKTFNGSSIKSVSEEFGVPQSTMKRFYMKYQQGIILQVVDMHPRALTGSNGTKTPTDGISEDKLPSPDDSENDDDSLMGVPGSNGTKKHKGYSCALSTEEETRLVDYVLCLSRCGKSLNMTDIRNIASSILDSSDKVAFKNSNLPSSGWLRRFKVRHPELEYKNHDYALNKTHQPLTRPELKSWESDLRNFLLSDWKVELDTFFSQENGSRIYTCDEIVIAFNKLEGKSEKEKIPKPAEEKELVSVIASASALGQYLKPFLVLPGDNSKATKSFPTLDPNSYVFQSSQSGLLNADIFNTWVTYFDSYLTQNDIQRPVVLLLDDHQAHFEIKNFLFCLDKQIVPVCLPGKLNKILQPLLANFFPKLMVAYQACCKRYTQKTGRGITYESFPYVMMKAWTLVSKSKFITDGFTHCKWIPMNICNHECVAEVLLENGGSKVVSKEDISDVESSSLTTPLPIKRELSEDPIPPSGDKVSPAPKKIVKKRKLSHGISSTSSDRSVILGDKSVPDERKLGRQEGIDMCLSVLESFVPTDILPVWKARTSTHTGTCEVEYCMWQAVKMLANGGLEVVSQMQKQQLQLSTPK